MLGRHRLPVLPLLLLLQRTPVAQFAATAERVVSAPVYAAMLKSAVALAALGSVNSLAGATEVVASGDNPLTIPAGTPVNVAFGIIGSGIGVPESWDLNSAAPPGLAFGGRTAPGTFNAQNPVLSGSPTTPGTYALKVVAWQFPNRSGDLTAEFTYTIVVTAGGSFSFTSQPVSATAAVAGTNLILTGVASSALPISYQWRRNGTNLAGATSNTLTVAASEATAGAYTLVATSGGVSLSSIAANVAVLTLPPRGVEIGAGRTLALTSAAANGSGVLYQWFKDGVQLAGAQSSALTIANATPTDAGSYSVKIATAFSSVMSSPAAVSVRESVPSRLSNMSVRTSLASGQTLIVGFVTSGPKGILLRAGGPALGPSGLNAFPESQVLSDPRIGYDGAAPAVDGNDDWPAGLRPEFDRLGAFSYPEASRDAAIERSVAGPHTALITGAGSGIVLVELYDAESGSAGKLKNVSARNRVGTGGDVLISGFAIDGPVAKTIIIRGLGPELANRGVTEVLANPKLELFDFPDGRKIAENDDWSATLAPYFTQVGAAALPAGSRDAALMITLPPGLYTAQVSGVANATGEGLVEVYEVE